MSINDRFGKIIRTLYGGNKSAFASAIGVAPSVVENIVGKRQGKPSFDVVEKVCAIAEVNTIWLITGRGDAFDFRPEEEKEKMACISSSTGIEDKLLAIIQEKDLWKRKISLSRLAGGNLLSKLKVDKTIRKKC